MAWSDYPESASEQARRALRHREENGSDCGTGVGWARARQLADREALSDETVKRTFSFLSRAKTYDQGGFTDADGAEICGSIMYAAWGGDPMLRWSERTVEKIDEEERTMKNEQYRHIQSIEEDETSITIVFAKPQEVEAEAGMTDDEDEMRSESTPEAEADPVEHRSTTAPVERKAAQMERRTFTAPVSIRMVHENGDSDKKKESRTIEGYAAIFNSETEMFGGEWVERIAPGAFTEVMQDDVRALFNHDPNHILARTASGTLQLWQDGRGLGYRFEAPNTTHGNDLLENIRNGNITQSSFGFTIQDYAMEYRGETEVFTITKVGRLFDVSPVTFPAYETTEVTARSIDQARNEKPEPEPEAKAQSVEDSIEYYKLRLAELD